MFFVLNREKMNSYLVSIGTVVVLFLVGIIITENNTKEVSININDEKINTIQNEIIE